MRFKKLRPPTAAALIVMAAYVLYLGISKDLDYYIHPRYIRFTVGMGALCLTLGAVSFVQARKVNDKHKHNHDDAANPVALAATGIIVILALALPAKALRSATVSQRISDAQTTRTAEHADATLLSGSSRGLGIIDWAQLLATKKEPSFYQNKPAKISGFIYDINLGDDTVWVARFTVTCCAVDAQPVGVPVHISQWKGAYKQDDWVEVEGEFSVQTTSKGDQLTLVPTSVQKIAEPENPYVN